MRRYYFGVPTLDCTEFLGCTQRPAVRVANNPIIARTKVEYLAKQGNSTTTDKTAKSVVKNNKAAKRAATNAAITAARAAKKAEKAALTTFQTPTETDMLEFVAAVNAVEKTSNKSANSKKAPKKAAKKEAAPLTMEEAARISQTKDAHKVWEKTIRAEVAAEAVKKEAAKVEKSYWAVTWDIIDRQELAARQVTPEEESEYWMQLASDIRISNLAKAEKRETKKNIVESRSNALKDAQLASEEIPSLKIGISELENYIEVLEVRIPKLESFIATKEAKYYIYASTESPRAQLVARRLGIELAFAEADLAKAKRLLPQFRMEKQKLSGKLATAKKAVLVFNYSSQFSRG